MRRNYSFHALFAYANNSNAYAQSPVFYAEICILFAHVRPFKILIFVETRYAQSPCTPMNCRFFLEDSLDIPFLDDDNPINPFTNQEEKVT